MHALLIKLVLCCLIFKSYGQEEEIIKSLGDSIKDYLDSDPITLNILGQVYAQTLTSEMRNMLHLSLNNLLITTQLFTSNDPNTYANNYTLP